LKGAPILLISLLSPESSSTEEFLGCARVEGSELSRSVELSIIPRDFYAKKVMEKREILKELGEELILCDEEELVTLGDFHMSLHNL